jgi:hypothetical protein
MHSNYRGFNITLVADPDWSAEIADAATGKAWSQRLRTPAAEGSAACLRRAQNLVDAFIALKRKG